MFLLTLPTRTIDANILPSSPSITSPGRILCRRGRHLCYKARRSRRGPFLAPRMLYI